MRLNNRWPRLRGTVSQGVGRIPLALVAAALVTCTSAFAKKDFYEGRSEWKPSEGEVAMLPPYCRPKQPSPEAYGCGVWFNHFCPALVALNRVNNPLLSKSAKHGYLGAAESHLRYTRSHLVPTCRLVPELEAAERTAAGLRGLMKR